MSVELSENVLFHQQAFVTEVTQKLSSSTLPGCRRSLNGGLSSWTSAPCSHSANKLQLLLGDVMCSEQSRVSNLTCCERKASDAPDFLPRKGELLSISLTSPQKLEMLWQTRTRPPYPLREREREGEGGRKKGRERKRERERGSARMEVKTLITD